MQYRIEKWNQAVVPNDEELAERMRAEGYSVFKWSDAPGSFYPDHEHAEDQSHWIVSGRLELSVRGVGEIILGPGDRDFMPAGTVHSARVIGDEPVVYLIGAKGRFEV
jgi:quercetin dioxygenase-like cupin family protein